MIDEKTKVKTKNPMRIFLFIIIDILFYHEDVMATEDLCLPHPQMHRRLFVLQPLKEVLLEWDHPILNKSMDELIQSCLRSSL